MRLWHYKLIPFLPQSQLIAQWRELNSIFSIGKQQINHILINYVRWLSDEQLLAYTLLVMKELDKRNIKYHETKLRNYFNVPENICWDESIYANGLNYEKMLYYYQNNPYPHIHTNRYLLQCFYNLQEKYDRGQKDFSKEQYERLEEFIKNEIH